MLSDIVLLLLIAFFALLVLGAWLEQPLVLVIAGMIGIFLAIQAYTDTGSQIVGVSLSILGLVVLLGGLHEMSG